MVVPLRYSGLVLILAATAVAEAPNPGSMVNMDQVGPRPQSVNLKDYAQVRYISDQGGSDTAPGTMDKPFKSLPAALKAAGNAAQTNRYAILVAKGHYTASNVELQPNVDLYGSFSPDWKSRDVFGNSSILDAAGAGPVLVAADKSRIDGFVITGGKNDGHGGGIVCKGVSPVISNNVITANKTIHSPVIKEGTLHIKGHEGGAIAVVGGANPQIINNLIFNNTTDVGDGGAIVIRGGSNPTISNNVIVANQTGLTDSTMYDGNLGSRSSNGAAMSISDTCCPTIQGNVFALNRAHNTNDGGAIYIEYEAMPHIKGNWFAGNTSSDDGGHIYVRGLVDNSPPKGEGPLIEENIFAGSRVFQAPRKLDRYDEAIFVSKAGRARIKGNLFTGQGSAVGVANSIITLEDNVIVNNEGAGVYVDLRVEKVPLSTVTGNTFWGNKEAQYQTVRTLSPVPIVTNNIIQGGYEGAGNRGDDPRFVDDSVKLTVTAKVYDPARCLTTLSAGGTLAEPILAGRVVNVGRQWSVIRSSAGNQLIVWGEITDPSDEMFIPGTFRRAK